MRGPVISRRLAIVGGLALVPTAARADPPTVAFVSAGSRSVRVTIWRAADPVRGVIHFSHGAASAPEKYRRLIDPWARAGFTVLAPLHADSTDHPDHAGLGMQDSWRFRLEDMAALERLGRDSRYVAAGHSYGGLVALTLGGANAERPAGFVGPLRDARATAVVAFSPPGPTPGLITAEGYAGLAVPAFVETGDRDKPFGTGDWRVHLTAFGQAHVQPAYGLTLQGVDHYFGGLICRPEAPGPPQTEGLDRASALSTDFLRAYAVADPEAQRRLAGGLGSHYGFSLARR